jgi:hypothetical protein
VDGLTLGADIQVQTLQSAPLLDGLSPQVKEAFAGLYTVTETEKVSVGTQVAVDMSTGEPVFIIAALVEVGEKRYQSVAVREWNRDAQAGDLVRQGLNEALESALLFAGVFVGDFPPPSLVPRVLEAPAQAEEHAAVTPTADSAVDPAPQATHFFCSNEDCGRPITEYVSGSTVQPPQKVADLTTGKYGRPLCVDCALQASRKGKRVN